LISGTTKGTFGSILKTELSSIAIVPFAADSGAISLLTSPLADIKEKSTSFNNSGVHNSTAICSPLNFNFLPIYPMFFPGHIHSPVEIIKISNFIEKILFNKNNEYLIHNILGKEKKSLWDLFFEMAFNRKKKTLKINLILINKFMPSIIKNFFKKNSSFLQQLVIIDHSKFKEKKEYL